MDRNKGKQIKQAFKKQEGLYTTPERSAIMQRIKGKDTKPERMLRAALWKRGFRYRLHSKGLPGKPDLAFPKHKLAVFIDGEFWHGYQWEERRRKIKTNRIYWIPKIEGNMARDRRNNLALEKAGWTVLRFWSKEVESSLDACLREIAFHLGYYE